MNTISDADGSVSNLSINDAYEKRRVEVIEHDLEGYACLGALKGLDVVPLGSLSASVLRNMEPTERNTGRQAAQWHIQ